MLKKIICPLYVLAEYLIANWKNEEGEELYSLYKKYPSIFLETIKLGVNSCDDDLMKCKHKSIKFGFTFHEILKNLYIRKIPIYYLIRPEQVISEDHKTITYEEFLPNSYNFYAGFGKYNVNGNGILHLYFSEEILDPLKAHHAENTLFSKNLILGERAKKLEEYYASLRDNEEEACKKYGKSYREMTQDEFDDYCSNTPFLKEIKGHYLDILWYSLTLRPEKK